MLISSCIGLALVIVLIVRWNKLVGSAGTIIPVCGLILLLMINTSSSSYHYGMGKVSTTENLPEGESFKVLGMLTNMEQVIALAEFNGETRIFSISRSNAMFLTNGTLYRVVGGGMK